MLHEITRDARIITRGSRGDVIATFPPHQSRVLAYKHAMEMAAYCGGQVAYDTTVEHVLSCFHEDDDGIEIEYETPMAEITRIGAVVRWTCPVGDSHECGLGEL